MANEPRWRRYLRFHRQNPAADLDDELRDHLQSTIDSLVARGMSSDEARAEAHRRFGDVGAVRSEVQSLDAQQDRLARRAEWLDTVRADVVFGLRQLWRAPAVTAVTAVSIGLGVALNVAVFSLANGLLLRPLPGVHSDRLARVYVNHHSGFGYPELDWLRARTKTLESLVGETLLPVPLDVGGNPERIVAAVATRAFFSTLGVRMALGRAFDTDERAAGEAVAVLSYATWQSRFGGDSLVLGRPVRLAGKLFTVVGVAEPAFNSSVMVWAPELWIPLAASPAFTGVPVDSFPGSFYGSARLRQGQSRASADAELATLARQLAATDSTRFGRLTFRTDHMRGTNAEMRAPFALASGFMLTMVMMVLIIACANVANLLLGRAAARRTEIGVRLALGASRRRLVRQLLTESLVLAATGGLVGVLAGYVVVRVVLRLVPTMAGLFIDFSPDWQVFAYAALLCVGSALLFGLAPALRASSASLTAMLRRDADSVGGRSRLRGTLVGGQVALCVVLLAVAVMLGRSFVSSRGVDPGLNASDVVDLQLDVGRARDAASGIALYRRIGDALSATPGVEAMTLASLVPLSGSSSETAFIPEGMEQASRDRRPLSHFNVIGTGYFAALEIRLAAGRDFQLTDDASASRVAIVNETAARRWWPEASALGKRIRVGGADGTEHVVVGVARDSKYNSYGEDPRTFVYLAFSQHYRSEMVAHVRVRNDAAAIRATLREAVRTVDPTVPPPVIKPMTDEIALALFPARFGATLLIAFGAIALLIAAAGIYGVTSYAVSRRTREIGIRVALGAPRGRVLRLIILGSMRAVGIGGAIGLGIALAASLALSRFLYGVTPVEPAMLLGVPAILGAVALFACWVPARRAARVDPVITMRAE